MKVPSLLSEARRRSGLTTRQLASRAATSHSAIAAYESGAKAPNTATFVRLIRACGFSIDAKLEPLSHFEDRVQRGRQLMEVLELADLFPNEHRPLAIRRFEAQ